MSSSGGEEYLSEIRRIASRRTRFGRRVRRLVPGVVVGSGALVGTGGLMAWVGDQPGLHATKTVAVASKSAPTQPAATDQVVSALTKQLRVDNLEVQQLDSMLSKLSQKRRAAAQASSAGSTQAVGGYSSGSGGSGSSSSGFAGPSASPSFGSFGSVNVPTLAPIAMPSPAPATNATTGASHVVP